MVSQAVRRGTRVIRELEYSLMSGALFSAGQMSRTSLIANDWAGIRMTSLAYHFL